MPAAFAFFLTWGTYGCRLHGDERGTVDDDHNLVGHPELPSSRVKVNIMRARMKDPPLTLTIPMRRAVSAAIHEHAAQRSLRLLAVAVQTEHVHVVVARSDNTTPELLMQRFKMWATRALYAKSLLAQGRKVWAHHGSTRWIDTDDSLIAAVDYVARLQDHPGRFARERAANTWKNPPES